MVMAGEVDNVGKFTKGYKLIDLAIKYNIKFDNNKLHCKIWHFNYKRNLQKFKR